MNETERRRETRRQNALDRLGNNNPACHCGETNPHCLEKHHIAGRKLDFQTVIVCRNCHRKLSDAQKDHPAIEPEIKDPSTELIGRFLLGLADLLKAIAERLFAFGLILLSPSGINQEISK